MSDDPRQTRAQAIEAAIRHLRDTFIAAGVDPSDTDSRERFGAEHRWMRDFRERVDRRHDAVAKVLGAVVTAIAIGVMTTGGPWLLRLLLKQ